MKRWSIYLSLLSVAGALPAAGISFAFDVSNIISPDQPTATVEVWASFNPGDYSFAGADFDVRAGTDAGGFSDPQAVLATFGTSDGIVSQNGDRVTGVIAGQIQFPLGGYESDTSNPILVWKATWGTSHFSNRTVDLSTLTRRFAVYLDADGNSKGYIGNGFQEGAGSITVVPAPGALTLVAATGLAAGRRRRAG